MFLQFLVSTVFCLGVAVIPMQVFSDNNPNTEEIIIAQEEAQELTKEEYIRKTLKETYDVFHKTLLESSWLQSDSGMSDEFITTIIFNNIGLPVVTQILRLSDTVVDVGELSFFIKSSIENLSKEQITSLILKDQEQSITFMFKKENESGGPSSYSVLTIDRNSFDANTPQMLKTIDKIVEENHVTEIGINIFSDLNPHAMIALSKYFKEKEINIHVVGFCNGNCASHLLLNTKNISIGPYGLISYDGFISNAYDEVLQVYKNNEKSQRVYQNSLENDEELESLLVKFYNSSEKRKELEDSIFGRERYRYLFSKIDTFLHENLELESMNEFTATQVILFLSEDEKELLYELSKRSKNVKQEAIDALSSYATAEKEFIKSRSPIESTLSYSIFDLFNLIHDISKSSFLEALYPDYQRKYQSQEVSQPLYIVPSESLLKNLGVNIIKGANYSSKMMKKNRDEDQNLLFFDLNESQIERCGFFKEDTNSSHTKQCLMDLLKNN